MPASAPRVSRRTADLHPSAIRELLALTEQANMISFAGGLPAPDSFPAFSLADLPTGALQYGASEGDRALRQEVAARLQARGLPCEAEQVLILSGSQQGIDLVGKLFVDAATPVLVESPTYLAALQVFRFFGARLHSFDPASPSLDGWQTQAPLAYLIPTFQNPTGRCLNEQQRQKVAAACDESGVTLFEDDPYRELCYEPLAQRPIASYLRNAPWIYQGSFSKSLAPGLRLGYLAAAVELMPYLVRLKQAADLHSNRLSQWLVLQQLQSGAADARLPELTAAYRTRRDVFAHSLQRHFADLGDWQLPPGGLFFWLRLRQPIDTRELLPAALAAGVAFMPGEIFYADDQPARGCLRLNFSHADPVQAETGLARLSGLVRAKLAAGSP